MMNTIALFSQSHEASEARPNLMTPGDKPDEIRPQTRENPALFQQIENGQKSNRQVTMFNQSVAPA